MSVQLISGANDERLNLAGQSVGQIRERFGSAFNIAPSATATLNDETVGDEAVVYDGDTLLFAKASAEKGA